MSIFAEVSIKISDFNLMNSLSFVFFRIHHCPSFVRLLFPKQTPTP
jgi:hypothetical protein